MANIRTIPTNTLKKDLQNSKDNIVVCEKALKHGIKKCHGSVKERININKLIVEVIAKELKRRNSKSLLDEE